MSPVPDAVRTLPARLAASRRLRRWALGLAIFLAVVGVLGFLVAPPLIRSTAERQLSALLDRPVTIARIGLNPYTLAIEVDGLRIGEPAGAAAFVTLGHFRVRPSWSSLFRLKPVVSELLIDALQINVVRSGPQQFNFSDLIGKFSKPDAAPKPKDSQPPLFAVSNIRIANSGIAFDDRVLGEQHRLERLNLALPFIANIPAKVDVAIQPHLDAVLDGSAFALNADAKPFAASLQSSIALKLDGLDLPTLLAYSPVPLPVKFTQAKLSLDLHLRFERSGETPSVALSGSADVAPLKLTDTAGAPLLEADRIHLAADVIEPLKPRAEIAELRIEHPVIDLARDAQGRLNLATLAAAPAAANAAPAPASPAPAKADAADTGAGALPDLTLKALRIDDGVVRFADHAVQPATAFTVDALSVAVDRLATRAQTPATVTVKARLAPGASLALDAKLVVPARSADAKLALSGFALPAIQPYLSPFLAATLAGGTLAVDAQAQIAAGGAQPEVRVGASRIAVQDFKLLGAAKRGGSVAFKQLAIAIDAVDLAAQRAEVGSVELAGLGASAARAADGSIDLAQFARSAPAAPAAARKPAKKPAPTAPWHYRIGRVAISQSALSFVDHASSEPVTLKLAGLELKTGAISDDERQPIALDLSATFQRKGRIAARGSVVRAPLKGRLALKGSELDVASFAPYFNTGINATLASALLKFTGDAHFAQKGDAFAGGYAGDVALGNLRLLDRETAELFAGFGELALSKLRASYDGKTPDVDITRVALSDFFAQVLLDAKGRLNVGRLMQGGDADPATAQAAPEKAPENAPASAPAATPATAAAPPAAPPSPPPFRLHIGEIALARGNIDYSDNFIQPNFRTNLTAIGGTIGALGTDATEAAPVDIKASLDGNGPVAINGLLNPLASPPMLDLAASARDIELTRFAAYSAKYAGYPIVKGKLQVDLRYALKDGGLTADNHIFIDQFTFGDHVDSPTATSLPIRLAISLLKNAKGEIDVDVPVSGSLNDPKFSIGGIIWRAFVNVIEKAVTSPFRLLAGALGGGGGEDLGAVEFAAGSAALSEAQAAKLDKLAKALNDRPALRLDLSGHADTALDTPALKLAAVDRLVRLQKLKDISGKGESIDVESVSVAPAEYEQYLTRAYKAADIKKPRNAIGLAKTLPAAEMKQLLLDNVSIGSADIQALAEARASAVQRGLAGKLEPGRVFAVAPKIDGEAPKEGSPLRVEFQLRSD